MRELSDPAFHLPVVTATFHGRDIFAPVAASLAKGTPIEVLGPAVDAAVLAPSPLRPAGIRDGVLETEAVYIDTFENVKLSALVTDLETALGTPRPGDRLALALGDGRSLDLPWSPVFGALPVGAPMVYADAYARVCIAVNQGRAAEALDLTEDLAIAIRRP